MKDQIVEEIRSVRKEIEQECDKAGVEFSAHILEQQAKYSGRLVQRETKKSLRQRIA